MNSENILQSDILDIIFEKRNKKYGAYALRKFYNNRLYRSLGVMILIAICFSAFTYLPEKTVVFSKPASDSILIVKVADIPKDKPLPPKAPEVPKPLSKPPTPTPPAPAQAFTNNIQIIKEPVTTKIKDLVDSIQIDNREVKAPGGPVKPIVQPVDVPSGGGGTGLVVTIVNPDIPVAHPEFMPEFPGDMKALTKFLERNLQNPKDLEEGETVSVKVKFIVGYDGSLKGFETIQDGGAAYNNEVMRVLKKMPQWIPGKSNGQNVSVFYVIPVKFTANQ